VLKNTIISSKVSETGPASETFCPEVFLIFEQYDMFKTQNLCGHNQLHVDSRSSCSAETGKS
jgi:hypothetical protein